MALQLA